ncbi:MAG: flagellar hook protein FlgE [Acidobacteriia bacterium]|nr:flagellar hook protein FlgE [Terriglobia bacterium]
MFTSFSTALSALNATSTAIDVVGNNLANMNTPGFKTSNVDFRDLVTQSLGSGLGTTQVGFGTGLPFTVAQFTQGALETTNGLSDAAIQGSGFFIVHDPSSGTEYTRAGNFQVDKNGNLMTDSGQYVQGWTQINSATSTVNTTGPIGNIVIPEGTLQAPVATTTFSASMNLNSAANADSTSSFTTPVTVYDSLGNPLVLTLNFQKTGANQWSYDVTVPGSAVSGGTAGTPFDTGASGTLTFDSSGNLTSPAAGSPISVNITGLTDGASDMNLNWNLYNSSGAPDLTQFAQASAPASNSQNGAPAAQLYQVSIADGGGVVAEYTNGSKVTVGQIALAAIENPATLVAVGNNNYQLSGATAAPSVGVPNTGGRGQIAGGSIESSTTDIATEFTSLIVYQRSYEANAHVVTTADQLSQDTINLIH